MSSFPIALGPSPRWGVPNTPEGEEGLVVSRGPGGGGWSAGERGRSRLRRPRFSPPRRLRQQTSCKTHNCIFLSCAISGYRENLSSEITTSLPALLCPAQTHGCSQQPRTDRENSDILTFFLHFSAQHTGKDPFARLFHTVEGGTEAARKKSSLCCFEATAVAPECASPCPRNVT